MKLAVIPARGGSKRIPRKNIKQFCGKPIIAWSIEAALRSKCFDRVIVSTDDDEIADVAREWGADVPFMRPALLANDYTGTIPVIQHAVDWCLEHDEAPEYICCIYATAPLISVADLWRGLAALVKSDTHYAFPVTKYPFPIQRAIRITENERVEMFKPNLFNTRSQDLEEAYHDAGQFYWGRVSAWQKNEPIFSSKSVPMLLPAYRVQDIDTLEDWQRAEWMFKAMRNNE